jgi:excisionase family DNA binding protein
VTAMFEKYSIPNEQFRMLTINEAAAAFPGLTAFRIRTLIKSGQLPALRAGKKYLVCEQTIREFILKNAAFCDKIPAQDNRAADERSSGNG